MCKDRKVHKKDLFYAKRYSKPIRVLFVSDMAIYIISLCTFFAFSEKTHATIADSTRRWGIEVSFMPGKVLATDHYVKKWLHEKQCMSFAAQWQHVALPSDSDAFAADYNYPTIGVGIRYAINHKVTMRRYADPDWGKLQPVDFDSHLGNTFSLYLAFNRPLFRSNAFSTGYSLNGGLGYSRYKYNKQTAPDNELIGAHWLIYFGASLYAMWHFADQWALKGSFDFYHHSNGALNRPNKGSNTCGPSLALVYAPYHVNMAHSCYEKYNPPFQKRFYINLSAGVGGKTLLEDWQLTQFGTDPDEEDYRTGNFKFYTAYSLQADLMYRYARRWASGIGADVFYGSYSNRVAEIDCANGSALRHSPWSVGVAVKHQAYFHNLSVAMSLGIYLFRRMGEQAKIVETPYYERIGVHYAFPSLHGLELGINVKAHKTKADLTELVVSVPLRLGERH